MKKFLFPKTKLAAIVLMCLIISCSDYLDKAPEAGLSEDEVFTTYNNFKAYFDASYFGGSKKNILTTTTALGFDSWDQKFIWETVTDACDQGRYMEGQAWKSGIMSEGLVNKMTYDTNRRPILATCFQCIRLANKTLQNIHRIEDADDVIKADFKGQAYFLRAWCHWSLYRLWGPMPYITVVLTAENRELWDMARLDGNECLNHIALDCDSAYACFAQAGKIRRDDDKSLNYSSFEMYRSNGMAAKALKSRVLLHAASPLNNKNGKTDWEKAAKASYDALQVALDNGIQLLPFSERYKNFYGSPVCEESIWSWYFGNGSKGWNSGDFAGLFVGIIGNSISGWSGACPTQNWVDKYETLTGYPLNTETDREAATAVNEYNEQNPFVNRDPRLATDIIYNQSPMIGFKNSKAQIYYDNGSPSQILSTKYLGRTYTGYLLRKQWPGNSQYNKIKAIIANPTMRLAELYLNYAEASNEAFGPGTIGVTGADLSALDAVNIIRTRAGMPDVRPEFTESTENLRGRIQNERDIELAFEGFYYDDIRRWKILPEVMSSTLYANIPEKVPVSDEYPTGFMYKRTPLSIDRQPMWKPQMYWLPFNIADKMKMSKFVANPDW